MSLLTALSHTAEPLQGLEDTGVEREREREREREKDKKRERERERESEIFCLTDAFRSLECNLNFAPSISVLRLCCFQFTPCQMRDR